MVYLFMFFFQNYALWIHGFYQPISETTTGITKKEVEIGDEFRTYLHNQNKERQTMLTKIQKFSRNQTESVKDL